MKVHNLEGGKQLSLIFSFLFIFLIPLVSAPLDVAINSNNVNGVNIEVPSGNGIFNNLVVTGNFSAKRPYGMFSSNLSQIVKTNNVVKVINFSHVEDSYLITLSELGQNLTILQSGDYLIELSVIVITDTNNKHINIWPQTTHNTNDIMTNVNRSNTRVEIENAGTEQIIAVPFILDMDAGDKFRIMYTSDDAGSMIVWTAGSGTGANAIPETPSIIMTVSKISEITD